MALKNAEIVDLYSSVHSTVAPNCDAFMHNLAGMKSLRLWCGWDVFRQLSWTFLRQECARQLRLISVFIGDSAAQEPTVSDWLSYLTEDMNRPVKELVRRCAALPPVPGGQALELDFSEREFSGASVSVAKSRKMT